MEQHMPKEINIRLAEARDADVLIQFNRGIARETEGMELPLDRIAPGVKTLLENPDLGFYVVAEIEGAIAGALMVTFEWSDWRNGLFWWIQSVYVRSEHRKRGIYRSLYQHIKTRAAHEPNVCGFRLYVEKNNTAAQQTYQALGMSETHYKIFEELCRV